MHQLENLSVQSSSFPLVVPVIWGRRYGCRSSLSSKPCLLHRPLSPTVCMSLLHTSFHLVFGLPLFSAMFRNKIVKKTQF